MLFTASLHFYTWCIGYLNSTQFLIYCKCTSYCIGDLIFFRLLINCSLSLHSDKALSLFGTFWAGGRVGIGVCDIFPFADFLSISFRYIVHFIKPFMITYVEEAIGEMITTAGPFPANMTWEEEMILSQLLQLWMLSTILPQEEMTLATLSEILLFDEYTQWHQQIHTGKCVISGSNVPLSTPSNASNDFCNVPGGGWWLLGWQTI